MTQFWKLVGLAGLVVLVACATNSQVSLRHLEVISEPREAAEFLLNPKPVGPGGYTAGMVVTIDVLPKDGWEITEWVGPVYEVSDKTARIDMVSTQTVVVRLGRVEKADPAEVVATLVPTLRPTVAPTETNAPTATPTSVPTATLAPTSKPRPTATSKPTPSIYSDCSQVTERNERINVGVYVTTFDVIWRLTNVCSVPIVVDTTIILYDQAGKILVADEVHHKLLIGPSDSRIFTRSVRNSSFIDLADVERYVLEIPWRVLN